MSFARGLATMVYGLLFRWLILFVPRWQELDDVLEILEGEGNERFLQ